MWRPPAALLLGLALTLPAWWPLAFADTDHLIFWAAGNQVVTGGSPYPTEVWVALAREYPHSHLQEMMAAPDAGLVWIYPPWTALLFAPFGALPREAGLWALHVAYVLGSVLAVSALIALAPWRSERTRSLAALVAITFQPLVIAAHWGQFTGWLVLGAALVLMALRRRGLAGLLAGAVLLAAKPQLTAVAGGVVALRLAHRRAWRQLGGTVAGLAALAALAIALDPGALASMLLGARQRVEAVNRFPTTWGFARSSGLEQWPLLAIALIAIALVACVVAVRGSTDRRDDTALAAALAFGVALTPYALTYEQALLTPALVLSAAGADRCRPLPKALLLCALVALAALCWTLFATSGTGPSLGIVPTLAVLLLAGAGAAARRWPAQAGATP